MKKLVGVASALIVSAGLVYAGGAPAQADSPGCVAKIEYRNVNRGMDKANVHHRFDTYGKQFSSYVIGGDHYQSREYKPCTDRRYGFVWVDYKNGHVTGKAAYWG